MRTGLSTIQQTLTPEAATVLSHSIAEAGRRNHGQTTPLHVAASLLSSPSGYLRQACVRSHPNSSHPLQCRALELCFSVALERLPTTQNGSEPPISNALMAALKRAQANQRRGCPEQQQQPLLAVKVELEQLVISILDDPSVSRVMREASFSSPAVKDTIEQAMASPASSVVNPSKIGLGFRPTPTPMAMPNRSLYLNPRLQQGHSGQSGPQRNEEVKRVVDILMRTKKRNPVLVGESEPEAVMKELLRRIEKGEFGDRLFKNVQVIQLEKEINILEKTRIPMKINELGSLIKNRIANSDTGGGVVLDLGDLKWLVEQPAGFGGPGAGGAGQQVVSEAGRVVVAEMGKLLAEFSEGSNGSRIWLIGTANCETYLRCQVYHPSMEQDWDLQAVPIASKSPLPGMFPRLAVNGIISNSVESLSPLRGFPTATTAPPRRVSENLDPARRMSCCPKCSGNYEKEVAKLSTEESEKSSEVKTDAARTSLPQWLQEAKVHNNNTTKTKDEEMILKQKTQELRKKWSDTCMNLHPNFHHNPSSEKITPAPLSLTGLYTPNPLLRQTLQPKLQQTKNIGHVLQLNPNMGANQPSSPPRSPVRTELVLGQTKIGETSPEKTNEDRVKDLLGCISSEPQTKFNDWKIEKFSKLADVDEFKKLLKGLMERVWWQKEAASALATSITRCNLGNGKRRGGGTKGHIWLLFTGPDRVGKKKMASVLSEQVGGGGNPVIVCLGSRRDEGESNTNFRGRTVLDRIVEAVRRNPFSVIMLEDIDEADMLVRGSIKRAMERGRLADSHGREISLGNIIFVLTANSDNFNVPSDNLLDETKLTSIARGGWQLRLSLGTKSTKRRANWLYDVDRTTKPRTELGLGLYFDLNEVADFEDDRTDGSQNSSDLTVDHEDELGLENTQFSTTSVPHELIAFLDDAIVFKPVNVRTIRRELLSSITKKFFSVLDDRVSIEVQDEALEKILGGVWLSRTGLEDWAEKVLVPSFHQLKSRIPFGSSYESMVVRLEPDSDLDSRSSGDWLPSKIAVND